MTAVPRAAIASSPEPEDGIDMPQRSCRVSVRPKRVAHQENQESMSSRLWRWLDRALAIASRRPSLITFSSTFTPSQFSSSCRATSSMSARYEVLIMAYAKQFLGGYRVVHALSSDAWSKERSGKKQEGRGLNSAWRMPLLRMFFILSPSLRLTESR